MRTVKTLIRLGGCPGLSVSLLGEQVILFVSCTVAIIYVTVPTSGLKSNTQ